MTISINHGYGVLIIFLSLYSFELNASTPIHIALSNQSQFISAIRHNYNDINTHQKQFKREKKEIIGLSSEGAQASYYNDGKHLKKIVLMVYGEGGRARYEYYFDNHSLSFCYEAIEKYDRNFGKVGEVRENRYYFHDNHLIKWLNHAKKAVNPNDAGFKSKEHEILEMVDLLKKASNLEYTCVQISSDGKVEQCPR